MKMNMEKEHASAGVSYSRWKPVGVAALFFCAAVMFGACSEDEDEGNGDGSSSATEVRIGSGNANMPSAGTIISQYGGTTSNTDIIKIVDSNVNSCYQVSRSSFYVIYAADKNVAVNYYTLRVGNGPSDEDPRSWTLSGSNDNVSWTQLDSQNGQTFESRYKQNEYLFANETEYRYYRLEVTGNAGAPSTQIAEWTMGWKEVSLTPDEPHSAVLDETNDNMPTGGTLTAQYSDYQEGESVGNVADGDANTAFSTSHTEFYLLWEGTESVVANYYSLTSANVAPDNAPSAWILYGSNDNAEWTQLDSQSGVNFNGRLEEKPYLLENETAYKYYKLEIKANGGGTLTQIGEWTLQDSFNIDDLMAFADGWSTSSETPMGSHFNGRHVTTDEDRAWLLDPNNEPDVKLYNQDWELKEFPVTLYPFGDPLPADVNQHAIGNCCALAIFGSMAYIYPDFIRSLITDNGDNTYTVDMFDPQGNPVQVRVSNKFFADSGGNMPCCTGKDGKATWSTVLEKAMMKWQRLYKVNENVNGIGSEHVAPLFTGDGDSFAFAPGKLGTSDLTRAVQVSLAQGKIMVGGFNRADIYAPDGSGSTVTGHAWTLMWTANSSAQFAMRNPWGFCSNADGKLDGVLNVFNGEMIPTIDLRIINPGKAAEYGNGQFKPYIPPTFAPQPMRVAEHLLRSGQ